MQVFLGTLIIVALSCLIMGLGQIITGKPLGGGCGKQGARGAACDACPNRAGKHDYRHQGSGEEDGGGSC